MYIYLHVKCPEILGSAEKSFCIMAPDICVSDRRARSCIKLVLRLRSVTLQSDHIIISRYIHVLVFR